MLQVALNGRRSKAEHARLPVSIDEIAADIAACRAAGADEFHLHPRAANGLETVDAEIVDEVVLAVTGERPELVVGVTTGAWIEPDLAHRLRHVRRWRAPRYTSVNVSEADYVDVIHAALDAGVGVEAGLWTVEDAVALAASGVGDRVMRVLVEPVVTAAPGGRSNRVSSARSNGGSSAGAGGGSSAGAGGVSSAGAGGVSSAGTGGAVAEALAVVEEIHLVLDRAGLGAPRLQHGERATTWPVLEDALRRGLDTRIGLEDTLHLPDGALAEGNPALVRAAIAMGA